VFTAVSLPLPDVTPRPLAWCEICNEINRAVQSWKSLSHNRRAFAY
jgi:DNA (cytosine-5)-methyltransferase 1